MKRAQILERLYINVPEDSVIPVIVDTDAKNEADDQYAIMHHLLSPKLKILGIVAAHYESKATVPGTTMEKSYEEIRKVLDLAEIEDVPVYRGCRWPLQDIGEKQDTPGVRFMIEEARKADEKIFIAAQGAMTNIASAINMAPDIAEKIIWKYHWQSCQGGYGLAAKLGLICMSSLQRKIAPRSGRSFYCVPGKTGLWEIIRR